MDLHELETSLVYIVSPRIARATEREKTKQPEMDLHTCVYVCSSMSELLGLYSLLCGTALDHDRILVSLAQASWGPVCQA